MRNSPIGTKKKHSNPSGRLSVKKMLSLLLRMRCYVECVFIIIISVNVLLGWRILLTWSIACFSSYVRHEVVCKLLEVADLKSAPFVLNASLK